MTLRSAMHNICVGHTVGSRFIVSNRGLVKITLLAEEGEDKV